MEVSTMSDLFKYDNPISPWNSFQSIPELYLEKGMRYVIRLIGPSYKTKRCYISRGNLAVTNLTTSFLKDLLNGKDVLSQINLKRVPNTLKEEVIKANDKRQWSSCLSVSCDVISVEDRYEDRYDNNRPIDSKGKSLHHLTIPGSGVAALFNLVKENPEMCLSGVFAHDIIIFKPRQGMGATEINISAKPSFLRKDSINALLNEGIPNTKKFYLDQNSSNIRKRGGYFYSFCEDKSVSSLDKYLEPLQTIKNYLEEDKQHDHIENDPKKLAEFEGIEPFGFTDIG